MENDFGEDLCPPASVGYGAVEGWGRPSGDEKTALRPEIDAGQSCIQVDVSGGAGQGQELLGLGVGKHLGELSAAHGLMGQQILGG